MSRSDVRILDAADAHGDGLRLEFFRVGPRWAHRLAALEHHTPRPLLESVEGDDHDTFPPSPALQQLEIQRQASGVIVALLIGMAGRNHWSVGIEAFSQQRCLRCDVACRHQPSAVGQLGSAYRMLVPWQLSDQPAAVATTESFQVALVPQPMGVTTRIDIVDSPECHLALQPAGDHSARTKRWCYEFRHMKYGRP